MTQFAPKHLCEKLQAAGLVSESEFFDSSGDPEPRHEQFEIEIVSGHTLLQTFKCRKLPKHSILHRTEHSKDVQAYTLLDLIGPSEHARANAVKWWGDGVVEVEVYKDMISKTTPALLIEGTAWKVHRHAIIDIKSDSEAWEYVERTGKDNE